MDESDLPDPGDQSVLAAAIKSGAQVIVTRNLKDFPAAALARRDIEARSPDAFILDQIGIKGRVVAGCIRQIAGSRVRPPESIEDVLNQLERDGLVKSVSTLRALTCARAVAATRPQAVDLRDVTVIASLAVGAQADYRGPARVHRESVALAREAR